MNFELSVFGNLYVCNIMSSNPRITIALQPHGSFAAPQSALHWHLTLYISYTCRMQDSNHIYIQFIRTHIHTYAHLHTLYGCNRFHRALHDRIYIIWMKAYTCMICSKTRPVLHWHRTIHIIAMMSCKTRITVAFATVRPNSGARAALAPHLYTHTHAPASRMLYYINLP